MLSPLIPAGLKSQIPTPDPLNHIPALSAPTRRHPPASRYEFNSSVSRLFLRSSPKVRRSCIASAV